MNATRKVKLKDITENLSCNLCKGYFIDATTIIECLHSFCKSCIVKHLEKSNYCPVCDVQLHSTKPLCSIRSDQMLQEIVYKLVPGLFRKEMTHRREFYEKHPESSPTNQADSGQIFNELYITSDDIIHLSLEYSTDDSDFRESTKRYLKCPAAVSISILKRLVQGKFDLKGDVQIDVMYGERTLPDEFLLMDVAYKYSWTNNGSKPLQLSYKIKNASLPSLLSTAAIKSTRSVSTPLPISKGRKSRTSVDIDTPSRSEILKSSNRNLLVESDITENQISSLTTPKRTPNGKVRGRRKRSLNSDGEAKPVENKRKKVGKSQVKDYREMESQSEASMTKPLETPAINSEKEVELRISENGVISARSINSGEEKIIGNFVKSTTTTTTNSKGDECSSTNGTNNTANASSSTDEAKSTNILDESGNNQTLNQSSSVHPLLVTSSTSIPSKSSYVKLNIPTISIANNTVTTTTAVKTSLCKSPNLKQQPNNNNNGNNNTVNGSPSAKIPILPAQKRTPNKVKQNGEKSKSHNAKSPINGLVAKSSPIEFESKKANVQKALFDLEKKLHTDLETTLNESKGNKSQMITPKINKSSPSSPSNSSSVNEISLSNQVKLSFSSPSKPSFTFPSSFDSAGMIVIPLNSTGGNNTNNALYSSTSTNTSPSQKRFAHHTTVVNGDLKFTTSPRHILPSICKDPHGSQESVGVVSKKPPKFFKSRHSSSSLPSDGESPKKKAKETSSSSKTKEGISGNSSNLNFNSITTKASIGTSTGANTTTTPSGITSAQNQALRFPPISNGYNSMNFNINPLQMTLAAAAAAANGNNLPMNLVPFVTSNYCSMPFLNQRSPYNMNFTSHLPFPFAYHGMNNANFSQATVSTVGSLVNNNNTNGNMNGGLNLTNQLQSRPSTSSTTDANNEGSKGLLDLSINKDAAKTKVDSEPNGKHPIKKNNLIPLQLSVEKKNDNLKDKIKSDPNKHLRPLQPKSTKAIADVAVSKSERGSNGVLNGEVKSLKVDNTKVSNKSSVESTPNLDTGRLVINTDNNNEPAEKKSIEKPKEINGNAENKQSTSNGHSASNGHGPIPSQTAEDSDDRKSPIQKNASVSSLKNSPNEKKEVPKSIASDAGTSEKVEAKDNTLNLSNGDHDKPLPDDLSSKKPSPCNNNNNNSSDNLLISQNLSTTGA